MKKQKTKIYLGIFIGLLMVITVLITTLSVKKNNGQTTQHQSPTAIGGKNIGGFCPERKEIFRTQSSDGVNNTIEEESILLSFFESPVDNRYGSNNNTYSLNAYSSPGRSTESILSQKFIEAFGQGELGCGSNSQSATIYGQKAMITQFHQLIQKSNDPKHEYIKQQTKILFNKAQKIGSKEYLPEYSNNFEMDGDNYKRAKDLPRDDPRYNPNDCVPVPVNNVISKRPLHRMHGILAFQQDLVAEVKSKENQGYSVMDVGSPSDTKILVDNILNLGIPIDNPQRGTVRWHQQWFKRFLIEELKMISDQEINHTIIQDAPLNPGKYYVQYKNWLKKSGKSVQYDTNMNQGILTPIPPQQQNPPIGGANQGGGTNGGNSVGPVPPVDQTKPREPIRLEPNKPINLPENNKATIIELPATKPIQEKSLQPIKPAIIENIITSPYTLGVRILFDSTIKNQQEEYEETIVPTTTTPTTRSLRF